MRKFLRALLFFFFISATAKLVAQTTPVQDTVVKKKKSNPKIIYGTASFYANKFNGRKTATGEIFSQQKMTAACNVLPLGTWIKDKNNTTGYTLK
jgi:rare lipoprotein A